MYKRLSLVCAVLLSVPSLAFGADLIVPSEVPTVEEALSRVRDGDRIVLLPGDYSLVALPPEGTAFSIVGKAGSDSTRITGAEPFEAILTVVGGMSPLYVKGITFDRSTEAATFSLLAKQRNITLEECRFLGGAGVSLDSCDGVVRGCEFRGCFDALRLQGSPILVEENEFVSTGQYSLIARGSEAKIFRNSFRECGSSCILIVGKRYVPVVGGDRLQANLFLGTKQHLLASQSKQEVNARSNYWGPTVTSTMNRLGYPASIDEIHDFWDQEERAAGMVDYRNWLQSAEEAGTRSLVRTALLPLVLILFAALLVAALLSRRRGRPAA